MMRIGIEAQRIFRSKKHGMDIVALELIKALQKIDDDNLYFIFVKKGDDHSCLKETHNFKIIEVPGLIYADWEQVFLPIYAKKYKLDILHCTSNTAPIFCPVPTIITLHDVIFLEKKNAKDQLFNFYQKLGRIYRKLIVPASIQRTKHIITVSNYEKEVIHKTLNIHDERISVVYNSFGTHFKLPADHSELAAILKRYELPSDYIFYIGNTDPKKNMLNTMKAYKNYVISSIDPLPLIVADVDDKVIDQILKTADASQYRHLIKTTGYIMNSDLPFIYAGAKVFLYPSLRESFGIPLLESMACGTPVITSSTSALPEIAGNAAILVDPHNENEITGALHTSIFNLEKREEMIKSGLERIKHFNWASSARVLKQIYQAI